MHSPAFIKSGFEPNPLHERFAGLLRKAALCMRYEPLLADPRAVRPGVRSDACRAARRQTVSEIRRDT
ncbi:hypothetical protein J8I87_36885 [Paraburkholderia sp. LEh10]|uniref:hypothetical protein n=1 Tax=Paraburkholderia sp. LEh10 TaxID=2821353 RepID=UPI001AEA67C8|nr:hypothetical protein [Paraburkholderia sp. LEh10]MBP0595139.1 hypothetical protein [Paraburkholderia sp. LEh10]